MGYFGKNITGSDKYEDFTYSLLTFLGWKDSDDYDPDDYKPHTERIGKEVFESNISEILNWFNESEFDTEHGLFLAYHFLIRGVNLTEKLINQFIETFKEDPWSKKDLERKVYMNLAIKDLEKYKTDKTPVDMDHYYYFEHYKIFKEKKGYPSLEEIKCLIEESIDIKILNVGQDEYSIYLILSEDDFKKIEGESIFGLKVMYI